MFQFLLHIVALICILLPTVLGYNLVFGKGKILHFGQVGLSLVAAYAMWVLVVRAEQSIFVGLLAGLTLSLLLAAFLAWLSFRLDPDGLGVMSIAVHLALLAVVLNWQWVTRGALGIPGIPRMPLMESLGGFVITASILALAWTFLLWRIDRGPFGRALAALSEHAWHAESLGVGRRRIHLGAFLIASVGASLTGVLLPSYIRFLGPADFGFPLMIFVITCVVAGGPGSVHGAVVATIALTFLRESLRFLELPHDFLGPVRLILFGLVLFVAVWLRRDVLFPQKRAV